MATETVERAGVAESDKVKSRAASTTGSLPVPDLLVERFRGIKYLKVPRLGRVTLIAGKNGVGKTTLLEAIQAFASRCDAGVLADILGTRREIISGVDNDGDPTVDFDWESLFWGRQSLRDQYLRIESDIADIRLRISVATFADIEPRYAEMDFVRMHGDTLVFKIETGDGSYRYFSTVPGARQRFGDRIPSSEAGFPESLTFEVLGPDVIFDGDLAELWDELIDSGGSKKEVLESLSEMYIDQVEDLDMVGDRSRFGRGIGRRAKVRLAGRDRPVPLESIGAGAVRTVGYVTAVSLVGRSLVLVDEIENGIHHTIQPRFWRTLIDAAARHDTQLIATTHSWDCVEAFAHAAEENDDVECLLIRLSELDGELRVIEYDQDDLRVAAEHGIEVR